MLKAVGGFFYVACAVAMVTTSTVCMAKLVWLAAKWGFTW